MPWTSMVPMLWSALLILSGALIAMYRDIANLKIQIVQCDKDNARQDTTITEQGRTINEQGKLLAEINQNVKNLDSVLHDGFDRLEKQISRS